MKSYDNYIPDQVQNQRYQNIMIMVSAIYLYVFRIRLRITRSSLHVPSSIPQTISFPGHSYSLSQPFFFIGHDVPIRRYLQARFIYLDNEVHTVYSLLLDLTFKDGGEHLGGNSYFT